MESHFVNGFADRWNTYEIKAYGTEHHFWIVVVIIQYGVGLIWEEILEVKIGWSQGNVFIHIKNIIGNGNSIFFLPFHVFCFFRFFSGIMWSLILIQTEQKFVECWMDHVEAARWLLDGL